MEQIVTILGLFLLGFMCFSIYFIFKNLQFVIQAINLYKKIVIRQDVIIKLLVDVRDNTRSVNIDDVDLSSEPIDKYPGQPVPLRNATLGPPEIPGSAPKGSLGFQFAKTRGDGLFRVTALYEECPARLAGLQVNDVIVKLNGEETASLSREDLVGRIREAEDKSVFEIHRGPDNTRLEVTVRRPG